MCLVDKEVRRVYSNPGTEPELGKAASYQVCAGGQPRSLYKSQQVLLPVELSLQALGYNCKNVF